MADAIILFVYRGSGAVRRGLFSLCAQAGDSSQGAVPEGNHNFSVRAGMRSGTGNNGGRIDDSGY